MAKGYIIARIEVTDPEVYARYTAETPRIAAAHGGRFLVRGGRFEQKEGPGRSRHVILEFADLEAARRFYESPDYQAILPHAFDGSERDLVLVEGVETED